MPGGRPSKFSLEVQERIVQAVSLGVPWELAPLVGAISYPTFREWMRRGENETDGEFRSFFEAVKEAEARAAMKLLAIIERAAHDGNWTAAAWKLERRYPANFGRLTQRIEHTGANGQALPEPKTNVNVLVNFAELAKTLQEVSDEDLAVLRRVADLACRPQPPPEGTDAPCRTGGGA